MVFTDGRLLRCSCGDETADDDSRLLRSRRDDVRMMALK